MRPLQCALTLLVALALQACGGGDAPTAPTTVVPTPDPAPAPIVITIAAQIVANTTQGLRSFHEPPVTTEDRNVHVTGSVSATGGTAMIDATVTYQQDSVQGQPATVPIELVALSLASVDPVDVGGTLFDVTVIGGSLLGSNPGGTVVVNVTGTDERGGVVNESLTVPVTGDQTRLPPGFDPCVPGDSTLCALGGRFRVEADWTDPTGNTGPAMVTPGQRGDNFVWFNFGGATSGVLDPNGFDLFVQLFDNCAQDNSFGVRLDGLSDLAAILRVTDTQANQTRTYANPLGEPFQPILDTQAFATCP